MKQILNFITLGVNDLEAMKKFYQEKFGWTILKDNGGIVFFKLNGLILSLFSAEELANDIGIQQDGKGFKRFTLAVNCRSEEEVDQMFERLKRKGITVVKEPEKAFWGGYSGYIADLENNYWEIAYNPFVVLDKDGNVTTHN